MRFPTVASNLGREPVGLVPPGGDLIFSSSPVDVEDLAARRVYTGLSRDCAVKEASVRALARRAGVESDWVDAGGAPSAFARGLVRILAALGFPCSSDAELADSRHCLLDRAGSGRPPPLVTASADRAFRLRSAGTSDDIPAELVQEDGACRSITLRRHATLLSDLAFRMWDIIDALADREVQLAVAPQRCVSIADMAAGRRRWGMAVQLYSLARAGDGGIGDTTALRALVCSAARHGADAIALSPVHSLFAANGEHISPYAPSSRLFLNALYARSVRRPASRFACRPS